MSEEQIKQFGILCLRIILALAAFILAYNKIEGWGWILVILFLTM
jgi:hypothetical protein